MDKNIFGSTCSLGGLLNDVLLTETEADQFLGELTLPASKGLDFLPPVENSAGTSNLDSSLSSEAGFDAEASAPLKSNDCPPFSSCLPTLAAPLPQGWQPATSAAQSTPGPAAAADNLALLSQLIGALQSGVVAAPQPAPQPQPQQNAANILAQYASAFRPAAPAAQQFAPVSQGIPAAPTAAAAPAVNPVLPSLNAQQQQALQAIMSLGQLGTTSEGKKVRRMLSNRESARRSRHRKQAHMQELEEKSAKIEAENASMKDALSRASQQELQALEERKRLYSEIAALREKVAHLESCSVHSKLSEPKIEITAKRGNSHASIAGGTSEDSCCDSLPAKGRGMELDNEETCCKRCRTSEASQA